MSKRSEYADDVKLAAYIKTLTKTQLLILAKQLNFIGSTSVDELILFLEKPEKYHCTNKNKVGGLLRVKFDNLYSDEQDYYKNKQLVIDNTIELKIAGFKFLPHFEYVLEIKHISDNKEVTRERTFSIYSIVKLDIV